MKTALPHNRVHILARRLGAVIAMALACTPATAADAPKSPASPASAPAKSGSASRVHFASPQAGVDALVAAMREHDLKALARVLGPGHRRIIDSGDANADREARQRFVAEYDAKHSLQMDGASKAVLSIGSDDWPMPIPLVKRTTSWTFDTDAGADELIARRVGRNELDTIEVCLAFVDMQREYAEADRNGDGTLEYAARFFSSPGKHDGLYWPSNAGDPPSPGGPRLAEANPQVKPKGAPVPYHGYYYRILKAQGKNAPGGQRNYLANGRLIGGIALAAYPATYLVSGVKTFMCNMDGVVYEKDLGPGTSAKAAKIVAYDPDPSWSKTK